MGVGSKGGGEGGSERGGGEGSCVWWWEWNILKSRLMIVIRLVPLRVCACVYVWRVVGLRVSM